MRSINEIIVHCADTPEGEIDGSVLMLFGQILVYSGSIFGVKIYIKDLIKRANK